MVELMNHYDYDFLMNHYDYDFLMNHYDYDFLINHYDYDFLINHYDYDFLRICEGATVNEVPFGAEFFLLNVMVKQFLWNTWYSNLCEIHGTCMV